MGGILEGNLPKTKQPLSANDIRRIYSSAPNSTRHAVGGVSGLELQKSVSGSCSWVLRTLVNGKRREIGVGGFPSVSLGEAREDARRLKSDIRSGIDPIAQRSHARLEAKRLKSLEATFGEAMEKFLAIKLEEFKNPKHQKQWKQTLNKYASSLLSLRVSEINHDDLMKVLEPIWLTKTETANRVRGRIEKIIDWAIFHGHRTEANPARWKGHLELALQTPSKIKKTKHHPALQLSQASNWYHDLRQRTGISPLALEFCALTAARSGEIRGAKWGEIEDELWIIPADRTKNGKEHRIPLSLRAIKILKTIERSSEFIFPNSKDGELSDAALSSCMRRINSNARVAYLDRKSGKPAVPHGLRSTFRDWVSELTEYPSEMAEVALGHTVGSAVERAYWRGDMLLKRRKMMEDWSNFLGAKI